MNSWKRSVLGMLCNIRKGFTPSTGNSSYWGGDIDWLSIADMNQGKYISSTNKKITEAGAKNRNIIKKGTLLMSFKLTIGKLGILNKDMYTNEAICNFQWNTPNMSTEFMYYYLSSINIKKYGSQAAKGITLNNDTLNAIPVFYPSFDEQEKIANFLSLIDKKIELMEKNHELLRKYKQSIIQGIFLQKMRLDDSVEWKEYFLKDLINETSVKTNENNQFQILSSTKEGIVSQEEYFNRQIASDNNIGYKILKRNQLVLSPQNLWLGNININKKFEIGIVSPSYKIYDINEKLILVDYMQFIIKTPRMIYEYENASEQGASVVRRNLNKDLFNNIKIKLPSIIEQKKIADFLSKIDNKIDSVEQQLEKIKEFKKYLLQQMFV